MSIARSTIQSNRINESFSLQRRCITREENKRTRTIKPGFERIERCEQFKRVESTFSSMRPGGCARWNKTTGFYSMNSNRSIRLSMRRTSSSACDVSVLRPGIAAGRVLPWRSARLSTCSDEHWTEAGRDLCVCSPSSSTRPDRNNERRRPMTQSAARSTRTANEFDLLWRVDFETTLEFEIRSGRVEWPELLLCKYRDNDLDKQRSNVFVR
jgi:hypothetical protein